jgi:hypothetical protein
VKVSTTYCRRRNLFFASLKAATLIALKPFPSPQLSRAGCRHQALRRTASGPTLARAPAGRRQGGDAGGGKGRLNFLYSHLFILQVLVLNKLDNFSVADPGVVVSIVVNIGSFLNYKAQSPTKTAVADY